MKKTGRAREKRLKFTPAPNSRRLESSLPLTAYWGYCTIACKGPLIAPTGLPPPCFWSAVLQLPSFSLWSSPANPSFPAKHGSFGDVQSAFLLFSDWLMSQNLCSIAQTTRWKASVPPSLSSNWVWENRWTPGLNSLLVVSCVCGGYPLLLIGIREFSRGKRDSEHYHVMGGSVVRSGSPAVANQGKVRHPPRPSHPFSQIHPSLTLRSGQSFTCHSMPRSWNALDSWSDWASRSGSYLGQRSLSPCAVSPKLYAGCRFYWRYSAWKHVGSDCLTEPR